MVQKSGFLKYFKNYLQLLQNLHIKKDYFFELVLQMGKTNTIWFHLYVEST